jgi:hypothetical protein
LLILVALKGGPGSGHHGHAGRPGQRGGSLPAGAGDAGAGTETGPTFSILDAGDEPTDDQYDQILAWEGARGNVAELALTEHDEGYPLVLEADGTEYVGIASVRFHGGVPSVSLAMRGDRGPYLEVSMLATKRRGYGRQMMDRIAAMAAEQGHGVYLAAAQQAIGFYEAIGMQQAAPGTNIFYWTLADIRERTGGKAMDDLSELEPEDGVFATGPVEKEIKGYIIEGDTWPDVHRMAGQLSGWALEIEPVEARFFEGGRAVHVKGITLGEVLTAGTRAGLDYWLGYAAASKGGPGSGNWGHSSETRRGVERGGGSDPGGGAVANATGYLAAWRRGRREGSEIRRKIADALIEHNPDKGFTPSNVDHLLGVMEMDREKFLYYGDRYNLGKAGDLNEMADALFKDEKERDRAFYYKTEELKNAAAMPDPLDPGNKWHAWNAQIGPELEGKAYAGLVGADLGEAVSIFQKRTGLAVQIGAQYDPDTAHKELSWLANMMEADPNLDACYRKAFGTVRFYSQEHGTAAMQVKDREVAVYPGLHFASMWYHEAGHGLEQIAMQAGAISFDRDLKSFGEGRVASRYSFANYQEDFAEGWVWMGAGYGKEYEAWAGPEKAAVVRRAMGVLQ